MEKARVKTGPAFARAFMTSVPASSLHALALDLAAALDQYEQDVEDLLHAWPDPGRYRRVTDSLEKVRRCAAVLPRLTIPTVELLIAHAELAQGLWDRTDWSSTLEESVWPIAEQHRARVFSLREACLTIVASNYRCGTAPSP